MTTAEYVTTRLERDIAELLNGRKGAGPIVLDRQRTSSSASRRRPMPLSRNRYGTVRNPGAVFSGVPTASELEQLEPDFAERYPLWLDASGEIGASYAQDV